MNVSLMNGRRQTVLLLNNHRLVSLLPICPKVFEEIISPLFEDLDKTNY